MNDIVKWEEFIHYLNEMNVHQIFIELLFAFILFSVYSLTSSLELLTTAT